MRESEAALAAEKERLAVTLYSIGDGVITTDTAGRVLSINKVAEQLTGWPQAEALGKPLPDLFKIIHETTREPLPNPLGNGVANRADLQPGATSDSRSRAMARNG